MRITKGDRMRALVSEKFIKIKDKGDELFKVESCHDDNIIICHCNNASGYFVVDVDSVDNFFYFDGQELKMIKYNRLGIEETKNGN